MKKIYTLLLTLSLAAVTSKASTHTVKHTVKKGETLSGIARKHHTSIAKVRQANGLKKSDVIKFGKVLKVPTNVYAANKKATISSKYVIKKGDTLSGIAVKHHTSVKKIRDANGLKKSDAIKIGKVLKVPAKAYVLKSKIVTKPTKYVIKRGDTLSGIARKHHTTLSKIRKANGLKKSETIKIGQVLKVPQNKKAIRYTKTKKKAPNKKLVASLSHLDTINLETAKAKKPAKFSFSDIFVSSKKDENGDKCKKITSLAKTKLGKRYVWGASGTKNTYDCSSFTKYVYRNVGVTIPRTSINQSKFGKYVKRDELQKGDLIFFDTSKRRKGYVNHVGIYLGNNKFIHASSAKKKVVVSSLSRFYGQRYKGARRPS